MKLLKTAGLVALLTFGSIGGAAAEKPIEAKARAETPTVANYVKKGTIKEGANEINYTVRKGSSFSVETTGAVGDEQSGAFQNITWWRFRECSTKAEYAPGKGTIMVLATSYSYKHYSILTMADYNCDGNVDTVSLEGSEKVVDFFTKSGFTEKANATKLFNSFIGEIVRKAVPSLENDIEAWLKGSE